MRCAEVCSHLSKFADGELGIWKRLKIRLHICRCKTCARKLDIIRLVQLKTEHALNEPCAAPDLTDLVMSQLPRQPEPTHKMPSKRRYVLTMAATGFLLVVCIVLSVRPQYKHSEKVNVAVSPAPAKVAATPTPAAEPTSPPVVKQKEVLVKDRVVKPKAKLLHHKWTPKIKHIERIEARPAVTVEEPAPEPQMEIEEDRKPSEWVVVVSIPVKCEPAAAADNQQMDGGVTHAEMNDNDSQGQAGREWSVYL